MTLWKLGGAVIARHGGPLGHPDLHTFFYGRRIREVSGLQRTALLPRQQRGGFTPDQLTQIDEDNLDLLGMVAALDQQSRCQPPDSWGIAARYWAGEPPTTENRSLRFQGGWGQRTLPRASPTHRATGWGRTG